MNTTPYPRACVNRQGNVEATFDEELRKEGYNVQRSVKFLYYEYADECKQPIRVQVWDSNTCAISIWQCRYLFGSDGAASVSRRAAGIPSLRHVSPRLLGSRRRSVRSAGKLPDRLAVKR